MIKSIGFSVLAGLFFLLSACTSSEVAPTPTTESAQARQARQWLTAPTKWVVQEATENGFVFFKRGVDKVGVADMNVEWLRFHADNRFEVKLINETVTNLFYKIDETRNELLVSPTADFKKLLDWRTRVSAIQSNQLQLSITEGSADQVVLTLIPLP